MSKDQYVGADETKLTRINELAESRLAAQLSIALAADQRAMTFAGIVSAGAAALIAWASSHSRGEAALTPIFVMIVALVVAAGMALWAANPIAWDAPGDTPASWVEDIADGQDDWESNLAAMADWRADMIEQNRVRSNTNANWLRGSMIVTFVGLVVGSLLALLA